MDKGMVITFILIVVVIVSFAVAMSVAMNNSLELKSCKLYSITGEVVYEDNFLWDHCFIIEDGEELRISQYQKKHKFDGVEVRK